KRDGAFCNVADQGEDRARFRRNAEDIVEAGILRADLRDFDAGSPHGNLREGNGANQEARRGLEHLQQRGHDLILYPKFLKSALRAALSASPSTPFGGEPSMTPIMPRPCSVSATTTSNGFAVAQ